ncbi:hypothetical protein BKA83DRAFT_4560155 [Pisolithus microcarpus]|nr:hypothetical protein BKA83DRAFT_4560155 [Pisolithus microcarpus]
MQMMLNLLSKLVLRESDSYRRTQRPDSLFEVIFFLFHVLNSLVPFTKEALQSPNFCKQATAAQRLESEHKRLTKILNSTRELADQHKNEAECIQGALDEFKAKHETEFAQARKYAAGLQHDKSDLQSALDAMKAEVAKVNRQFGPKYGSPLTPGAASAQDFLTPVAPEVDDVFTTDGASTNRRKMDSSAVFQPENFEDIANISPDPSPSRPFQTANHPSKEIEDLQQRLQHAQRQIKKLTGSIHREKEMHIDYKRKLEASSSYVHDENEPPEDAMFDDDNTASIESKLKRKVTPFRSVRRRGHRGRRGGLCHRLGNAASTPSSDYAGEADLMLSPPPPVPSIPGQFQDGTDDLDPELSEGEGDEHQPDPIQSSPSPLAIPSNRTSVDGMDPFYANVLRKSASYSSLLSSSSPLKQRSVCILLLFKPVNPKSRHLQRRRVPSRAHSPPLHAARPSPKQTYLVCPLETRAATLPFETLVCLAHSRSLTKQTRVRMTSMTALWKLVSKRAEDYHDACMSIGMTTPWESREDFHSMLTMSDNDYPESEDDESIKGSHMPSRASPSRLLSTRRKALKRGSRMLRSWKWRSSKKLSSARKIHSVPLSNIRHFRLSQIKRKLFNKQVPNIGVSSSASATFRLAICDYSQFSYTSRMADAQKMNVESPTTSQEINHHIASTEAQSTIPTSLVRPQTSVATIPGTPGANSGCSSFVLPSISSASRCKPGSNTIRAQGTPLAVGIVRGWKPNAIPSSLITPSHANPSGLSSSLLKSSMLKTAVSQEDDDAQHVPTSISDADQDGSEQEEARFLLEVARAQRLVRSIEQELAKAKLKENIALGELYKFHAEEAERRLELVEFELGCMRNSMRNSTVALDNEPSDHKCCHTSLSSVF